MIFQDAEIAISYSESRDGWWRWARGRGFRVWRYARGVAKVTDEIALCIQPSARRSMVERRHP